MIAAPDLPPLMRALACADDPVQAACAAARAGTDPGLILWRDSFTELQAALVLAPDVALAQAMAALPACMVGMQNALGSLGPSEQAVTLGWDGAVMLNGARAGRFRVAASSADPGQIPDWLVVGFDLIQRTDPMIEGGETPDQTTMEAEAMALPPAELIGAWGRHSLYWLNGVEDTAGRAALARELQGLCIDLKREGVLGLDDDFGLLSRDRDAHRITPLTTLLEIP